MKLPASLILAVVFPTLWVIVFLLENVDRKFTQFIEERQYKITGNFHGPRYSWLLNKNHLISSNDGAVSLNLEHSFGNKVYVDDIRIDNVSVFYDNLSVGMPQKYQGITSGAKLSDIKTPEEGWGMVEEYDPNTEDGRFLWYDSVENRTIVSKKVGGVWTILYDVEGDRRADPEALEVFNTGRISTLDPDKIYKIASDVVNEIIEKKKWTSSTGTITKSEIPK